MMTLYSTSFTSSVVVMIVVIAVINFVAQSQGNTSNQNPLDCVPSCRCSAYNVSCEGPAIVDDTNIRKSTRNLSFIGESINGRKMPLSMPFNLTTYPLLKLLNISNTGLRELLRPDFVTVTELEILLLTYNNIFRIEDLSFNNMNKLTKLDLSHNIIGSLSNNTFTGLNSLTILYLSDNQISNIAIDAFKGLHTLGFMFFSNNLLENIEPETFQNLSRLQYLDLRNNSIRELRKGMFDDQSNLILLNLQENQISKIDVDAFKGLHALKSINLSNNTIRELRKGMFDDQSNLEWLSFSYNLLEYIEPGTFQNLSRLKWLYFSNNQLENIEPGTFQNLSRLEILNMTGNSITSLPSGAFRGLESIMKLSFNNNLLKYIEPGTFQNLSRLEYLYFSNNQLEYIEPGTFQNLSRLEILYLKQNLLEYIEPGTFQNLTRLEWLGLSSNKIRKLKKGMFDDQSNLVWLDLSFNPLNYIEPGTFRNLSRLETLNMVNVKLASLKPDTFKGITSLKFLSTDDKRLCCLFEETDVCTIAYPNFLDSCSRLMPNTILRIAMWIIGWGALIGNTIVLVLRCRTDHSVTAKTQGLFIFNLAIADFLMGVYMIIIASVDVYYGEYFYLFAEQWRGSVACKGVGFIAVLSNETSVFILAIITIDRVLNVVSPFGKLKFRATSARVGVALIWTIAVVVSIVPLIISSDISGFYGLPDVCVGLPLNVESRETGKLVFNHETYLWEKPQYETTKRPSWVYSIALFLGVNFLIFILILLSYVVIFVHVRKSARSVANPVGGSGSIDRAREVKMATRMAIIVLTDFFCWMPVIIMGILSQTGAVTLPVSLHAWSVVFILPINASINPYLYTFIAICDGSKKRST